MITLSPNFVRKVVTNSWRCVFHLCKVFQLPRIGRKKAIKYHSQSHSSYESTHSSPTVRFVYKRGIIIWLFPTQHLYSDTLQIAKNKAIALLYFVVDSFSRIQVYLIMELCFCTERRKKDYIKLPANTIV